MTQIKNAGFTLMEVLVATVISVSMLTLVMGSFWALWQTYQLSELMRDMQHESAFAMTRMADKIRAQGLDYAAYDPGGDCGPSHVQTHRLCLGGDDFFQFDDGAENLYMGEFGATDPLFSTDKFVITRLEFERFPLEAPTRANTNSQFQAQVSLYFEMVSRVDEWGRPIDPAEALVLPVQTTISSRDYNF